MHTCLGRYVNIAVFGSIQNLACNQVSAMILRHRKRKLQVENARGPTFACELAQALLVSNWMEVMR